MTGWKDRTRKEIARELRLRDRAKLRELRERIRALRLRRREALAAIRSDCSRARDRVRSKLKALRAETLAALRAKADNMRKAQAGTCTVSKRRARAALALELERAAKELRSERFTQQVIRDADARNKKLGKQRRTRAEARSESNDEVRGNLPRELIPVFDAVHSKIKGSARKSRTEAFLQWAEENPGEVWTIRQRDADRELAQLLAEEKQQVRSMRKARRYRHPEALAAGLSEVPF